MSLNLLVLPCPALLRIVQHPSRFRKRLGHSGLTTRPEVQYTVGRVDCHHHHAAAAAAAAVLDHEQHARTRRR